MRVWLKAIAVVATAVVVGLLANQLSKPEPFQIHFLSVGQGDCTVIQYHGISILIDCGPKTDQFDAGTRIVVPKLRSYGIDRVNLALLTHPDADHIGGFPGIQNRIPVSQILLPEYFVRHPAILNLITESRIDAKTVFATKDGTIIRIDDLQLRVFTSEDGSLNNDNDGSLVCQILVGDRPIALVSGDLGSDGELSLLQKLQDGTPLMLAGHHGSAGSTSTAWLRDAKPKFVIVSCSATNNYGHPAGPTLSRIAESGATLLRTDQLGDVSFELENGELKRIP